MTNFRKLNIHKKPLDQASDSEVYDVVIASQILLATQSIDASMANVRKLLKPYASVHHFH